MCWWLNPIHNLMNRVLSNNWVVEHPWLSGLLLLVMIGVAIVIPVSAGWAQRKKGVSFADGVQAASSWIQAVAVFAGMGCAIYAVIAAREQTMLSANESILAELRQIENDSASMSLFTPIVPESRTNSLLTQLQFRVDVIALGTNDCRIASLVSGNDAKPIVEWKTIGELARKLDDGKTWNDPDMNALRDAYTTFDQYFYWLEGVFWSRHDKLLLERDWDDLEKFAARFLFQHPLFLCAVFEEGENKLLHEDYRDWLYERITATEGDITNVFREISKLKKGR